MAIVTSTTALPWDEFATANVTSTTAMPWGSGALVTSLGHPWNPPPPPPGAVDPVPPGTPRYVIPRKARYDIRHTLGMYIQAADGPIFVDPISISFGIDADAVCWTLNAEVWSGHFDDLLAMPPVSIALDGQEWLFIVEDVTRSRVYPGATVTITGRSAAMVAAEPYQRERNYLNEGPITAAQMLDGALLESETLLRWELNDWLIPDRVLSYPGSPLGLAQRLGETVGALVRTDRAENAVIVSPRYPSLPNRWPQVNPDVEIWIDAAESDGYRRADKPAYNAIYVTGQQQGVFAYCRRAGTNGDLLAPMVTDLLITDMEAALQRGEAELGGAGRQVRQTLRLPVLTGPGEPGVLDLNWICRVIDGAQRYWGIVRSVAVEVQVQDDAVTASQTVVLERHIGYVEGTVSDAPPPGGVDTGGPILTPPPRDPPPGTPSDLPDPEPPAPAPAPPPATGDRYTSFPYPPDGEQSGIVVAGGRAWADMIGQWTGYDTTRSALAGKAFYQLSESGWLRSDGSKVIERRANPLDSERSVIRMTCRAKDMPLSSSVSTFRTQVGWGPRIANVVDEEITINKTYWHWYKFHFASMPEGFDGRVLLMQNHATKELDSWGGKSPPQSIVMDKTGGKWVMQACFQQQPDGMKYRGTGKAGGGTAKYTTLVADVRPNVEYTIIWHYRLAFDNTGFWDCWINGVKHTLATNTPTTYPLDGKELDANGVEKFPYYQFATLSQYCFWYTKSGSASWVIDQNVSAFGYCQAKPGHDYETWAATLAEE